MKKKRQSSVAEIINLFFENKYSKEQEENIQRWIIDENHAEEKDFYLRAYWENCFIEADSSVYKSLNEVNRKIGFIAKNEKKPYFSLILRVAAIITIPLLIVGGVYFYNSGVGDQQIAEVTSVENLPKPEFIEFAVPYGSQEHITLPDNSKVWLNAGSSLSYADNHKKDSKRIIKLRGEAYFEIVENKERPIIVETPYFSIKVLGTKFNVRAYPGDSNAVVELKSGKIQIKTINDEVHILEGEKQLIFNNESNTSEVGEIDNDYSAGWTKGYIVCNDMTLGEIFRFLERHFNVTIEADKQILTDEIYSVRFTQEENIHQIMSVIKDLIGNVRIDIRADKVYLYSD